MIIVHLEYEELQYDILHTVDGVRYLWMNWSFSAAVNSWIFDAKRIEQARWERSKINVHKSLYYRLIMAILCYPFQECIHEDGGRSIHRWILMRITVVRQSIVDTVPSSILRMMATISLQSCQGCSYSRDERKQSDRWKISWDQRSKINLDDEIANGWLLLHIENGVFEGENDRSLKGRN